MIKKIIDWEILELPKIYLKGNANTAPKKLAMRWKDDKRIVGYVHDNDEKNKKIIQRIGMTNTRIFESVLKLGSALTDESGNGFMKNFYPLKIFSFDKLNLLFESPLYDECLYFLPFC